MLRHIVFQSLNGAARVRSTSTGIAFMDPLGAIASVITLVHAVSIAIEHARKIYHAQEELETMQVKAPACLPLDFMQQNIL